MFRSADPAPLPGTELAAVLAARRASIVGMTTVLAVGALGMLVLELDRFPPGQLAVAVLVFPAAAMVWRTRRSDTAIRWALVTVLLQALSTVFSKPYTDARLSASILFFVAAAFGAVSLRRRVRRLWQAAVVFLWMLIVPATALPVTISGQTFNARWATLTQLIACTWSVNRMWDSEIRRVRLRDDLAERRLQESMQALAFRERVRVWRESLVRIHETVLNDIRSALDLERVDWRRLGGQLAGHRASAPPDTPETDLRGILASIAQTEDLGAALVAADVPLLRFSPERAAALRSLLLELARNLMRHSAATKITIAAERNAEFLELRLRHNGHDARTGDQAGIGLGIVLADALTVLHATMDSRAGVIELRLPVQPQDTDVELLMDSNMWRTVLAAGASGLAAGGLPHYLLIAATFGATGTAMAALAVVSSAIPVYATARRRTLPPWLLVLATVTATAVPLLAATTPLTCGQADLPIIIATLSTVSLSATLLWAPSPRWWWLASGSFFAMARLALLSDLDCKPSGEASFLAALIAPIMLTVVYVAFRSSTERESQARVLEHDAAMAAVSAEAARSVGAELHTAVREATDLLAACAERESISASERIRLRCLDAEIRATIQVNPETAGGFALACRELVHEVCERNVPVHVLTLRDSGDKRPLPEPVVRALRTLLRHAQDASIRVLTSPGEDRLVLTTSHANAVRSGLPSDWRVEFEDGVADLDATDPEAPAMLMVLRRTGA